MSGFPPGGPPFGGPPPFNYGGQYMPPYQGAMTYNNNMMPHQASLQQQVPQYPQFQQHRPPPFPPQIPQTPNQMHFANNTAFHHNNGQFSQPGFQQGPPPAPPPAYYNYGQFNNGVSGSPYTPTTQNQTFGAGTPAPLNMSGNSAPTPQMLNGIPATSSTSNTPIRPTFNPQQASIMSNPFERRGSGDFQIHNRPAPELPMVERKAGFGSQSSIPEPFGRQPQAPEADLSENVIEPIRKEPEPQRTAYSVDEEASMDVDPKGSNELNMSENPPQPTANQEFTGSAVKETSMRRPGSSETSQEDFYMTDTSPKLAPTPPARIETQESRIRQLVSIRLTKREQAKQALRDLEKINVGFSEMSHEQLDLGLLKQLYLEAGLPISNKQGPSAVQSIAKDPIQEGVANGSLHLRAQAPLAGFNAATLPEKLRPEPPSQDDRVDLKSTQADKPASPPSAIVTNTVAKGSTPQGGNGATPTESADRSQGRKDYIARLLAAKAGVKQDPITVPTKLGESDLGLEATKVQEAVDETPRPTSSSQSTSEAKKAEMKDPKQTELIRQRLEALKNSAKTQRSLFQSSSTSTPLRTEQALFTPAERPNENKASELFEKESSSKNEPASMSASNPFDPSRSFFAPTNRAPSGGLPGLSGLSGFSLPGTATNANPPVQPPPASNNHDNDYQEEDGEIMSEEEQGQVPSTGEYVPASKPEVTANTISLSTTPDSVKSAENVVMTSAAPEPSRKRPMAADFIDSPPRKAIRRPASSEPIHLVIEVSDNEDEGSINEQPEQNGVASSIITQNLRDEGINGRRGLGELPPLSDFPPRSAENRTPKVMTPSLAQQEEEISRIRKRIAEAELRRKTKGAGDTPSSTFANSPVPSGIALARTVETKQQAIKEVNEQLAERENALALAKREIQRKLEAERQNQTRIAALAEQERQQATLAATSAEKQARLSRKATLEAALPDLDAQIDAAMAKLEDMKRQQDEIQAEIQRGNAGRTALVNELSEIAKALEVGGASPEPLKGQYDDSMEIEETNKVSQPDFGRSPHTETPEQAPRPSNIIIPKEPPPEHGQGTLPTPQTARTEPGEVMDIASSSEDEGQIIESASSASRGSQEAAAEESLQAERGEGIQEVEIEDVVEEYEPAAIVPDVESTQLPRTIDRMSIDETQAKVNEDYEPSLEIEVISSGSARSPSQDTHELPDYEEEATHPPHNLGPYQANDEGSQSTIISSLDSLQEEGEISEGEEISDDYEPPEVSYPVQSTNSDALQSPTTSAIPTELAPQYVDDMAVATETRRSADTVPGLMINATDVEMEGDVDEHEPSDLNPTFGHFTPYESPLRNFSSYRFHPQYVEEVPGGFHSLTFNHKIKAGEVLCRWELAGGICNDPSCDYQHFKDLPLTDNNLLLQLGSVQEGSSKEERDAYIFGLRQMISGMRDKNLKDITAIASEIVAYRSRFLNDSSRVLTNIQDSS